LFLFVFPTTALLHQRGQLNEAQERLSVLKEQSARLEQQTVRVESDQEIERLARDRFNMVKPGEQAWAVVPAPLPTTTTTVTTPPSLPAVP
jgi:cell division protein FtsB